MTRPFDAARKGDAFWQGFATETTVRSPRRLQQAERMAVRPRNVPAGQETFTHEPRAITDDRDGELH